MSQSKPTLCWKCSKACGGCSWSDGTFTPVEGWTATETTIRGDRGIWRDRIIQSYIVEECPEYEEDS